MPGPRRLYAVAVGAALVAAPAVVAASPAAAATESVALVGSLQSELGCPGDWDPACPDTELAQVGDIALYRATFDVPGGTFGFKVALNDSWAENYGAGGALDGGRTSPCCSPARRRSRSPTTTSRTSSRSHPSSTRTRCPPTRARRGLAALAAHPRALLLPHGRPLRERVDGQRRSAA